MCVRVCVCVLHRPHKGCNIGYLYNICSVWGMTSYPYFHSATKLDRPHRVCNIGYRYNICSVWGMTFCPYCHSATKLNSLHIGWNIGTATLVIVIISAQYGV